MILLKLRYAPVLLLSAVLAAAGPSARAETSLADAYKVIASKQMVDLTHSFSPATPVWSGFGQATMTAASDPKTHEPYTIEKNGFRTIFYSMVGQYGTHVDPPAHFDPNGMTMDKIPLKQMILPLVVLDDTPYPGQGPEPRLLVDDLNAWEKEHGQVPKGCVRRAAHRHVQGLGQQPRAFQARPFPAWSLDVIKVLFEQRGVTAIGHEAMDTDTTDAMDSETWILHNGHFQIEVMANLDQVPAKGALDRRDLAQGRERPRLPGPGVRDPAVAGSGSPRPRNRSN